MWYSALTSFIVGCHNAVWLPLHLLSDRLWMLGWWGTVMIGDRLSMLGWWGILMIDDRLSMLGWWGMLMIGDRLSMLGWWGVLMIDDRLSMMRWVTFYFINIQPLSRTGDSICVTFRKNSSSNMFYVHRYILEVHCKLFNMVLLFSVSKANRSGTVWTL